MKNAQIKVQESNETWRFGRDPVDILQHLWPHKFEKMTCADPTKNTPAIPIIFNQLDNWQYDKNAGFVQRSETLFSMVLVIIAIELVVAHFRSTPSSITLLWPLRQPLDALANFLEYWVGTMCELVHLQFGIPFPVEQRWVFAFYTDAYKKTVDHHGTQNVNGVTRTVVLSYIVRRMKWDKSWQGEVLEPYVHVQSLTRATDRHYVFIEDLAEGIDIPPKCHSLAKTLNMPATQMKSQGTDSIVRKQLTIVKLMRWLEDKDPRTKRRRNANPHYRYLNPLIPALDSHVLNGVTRTVVLSYIVRRMKWDKSWQGEVLEPYVHVQSLTRATDRHYVFIEDLAEGIDIPPKCHSLAKTLNMPATQMKSQGTDSIVRKQLTIVKLMRWLEDKDPRTKRRRNANPHYRYLNPLIPALDSHVFRQAMYDAQGQGEVIAQKITETIIARFCQEARDLYSRHEEWWPSSAITRNPVPASTLFGSDKSFQALATSNKPDFKKAWTTLLDAAEHLPDDKNNQRLATKRDRSRTDLLLLRTFSMDIIERQPHL